MATVAERTEVVRPRTRFLAVAPVIAGTGVAADDGQLAVITACLLAVALVFARHG